MTTAPDFYIKQNDTLPLIAAQLTDADGNAIDLSTASVSFHMKDSEGDVIIDTTATIDDTTTAEVSYGWSQSDTEVSGHFYAEWEVSYNDGTTETFPNDGHLLISITEDIS